MIYVTSTVNLTRTAPVAKRAARLVEIQDAELNAKTGNLYSETLVCYCFD